jgi:hypothetical protein
VCEALTHLARSIVGGGLDIVTCIFTDEGCRWINCGLSVYNFGYITQDSSVQIVNAPLTLILGNRYYLVRSLYV